MPFYDKRLYVRKAEAAVGHPLPKDVIVHHIDQDRTNNSNSNLVVLQDQAEHQELHRKLRVLRAGGNPWIQYLCGTCKELKTTDDFSPAPRRKMGIHSECKPCAATRAHRRWCEKQGKPVRYQTAAERSEQNRQLALRRWAA